MNAISVFVVRPAYLWSGGILWAKPRRASPTGGEVLRAGRTHREFTQGIPEPLRLAAGLRVPSRRAQRARWHGRRRPPHRPRTPPRPRTRRPGKKPPGAEIGA